MKQIKTMKLAFTYVGCFLGAGYLSGQELWQFFGSFGNWGYVGFALAVTLFTIIGILFIRLTQMTQCADMDKLMVPWDIKWLRASSGGIGAAFLFFVVLLMAAGVGALLMQLFAVPAWLGSAVFMAVVFLVALLGVNGMVNAFSALIPVLVPLLLSSFRRADELALAMECRCYHGGEGRTRMKVMQLHARDFLFFFSLLLFIGVRFLPMLDCSVIGLEDMNFTF